MDSLAAMYEKAQAAQKNNCDEGNCSCGCGGSSCNCGCEGDDEDSNTGEQQFSSEPNPDGIVIYTKSGCPFCAKVLQEYREQGIRFQEINTSVQTWAKKLCNDKYGADKVPIIVKDGVVIQIGDVDGKG
jgi:glutaredoxin 3